MDDDDDDLLTPLVYATELARSVDLGFPKKFEERNASGAVTDTVAGVALKRATLDITKAKKKKIKVGDTMVVGGLIYGLVNVRTDGERILCATLNEKDQSWEIHTTESRF